MSKQPKPTEDLTIIGTVAGNAPPQYTEIEYSSTSWQRYPVLPPIPEDRKKAAKSHQPKPPSTAITPQSSQKAKTFKRASNLTEKF
jgi:hypothetical protein